MQRLTNFVFILILVLMGTALPLNTQIMNINLTDPIITDPGTTTTPGNVVTQGKISLIRPSYDAIGLGSASGENALVLVFESDNGVFSEHYFAELQPVLIATDSQNTVTRIDLSSYVPVSTGVGRSELRLTHQDLIALLPEKQGYFLLKLELSGRKLDAALDGSWLVSTLSYDGTPLAARTADNPIGSDQRVFTLYVPDASYTEVIPVSRIVAADSLDWYKVYLQLRDGVSAALGLREQPILPTLRYYDATSGGIVIDLSSQDAKPFTGTPEQIRALGDALNETYLSYVPSLRGTTVRLDGTPIYEQTNTTKLRSCRIYRGATQHVFLQPVTWTTTSTAPEAIAAELIDRLVQNDVLPPTVLLEECYLTPETGALNVQLSPEYDTVLSAHPGYEQLMKNAVALSLYSIPEVQTLMINGASVPRITAVNLEP